MAVFLTSLFSIPFFIPDNGQALPSFQIQACQSNPRSSQIIHHFFIPDSPDIIKTSSKHHQNPPKISKCFVMLCDAHG